MVATAGYVEKQRKSSASDCVIQWKDTAESTEIKTPSGGKTVACRGAARDAP